MGNEIYELEGEGQVGIAPPESVVGRYDGTLNNVHGMLGALQAASSDAIYSVINRGGINMTSDQNGLINMRKVQAAAQIFSEISQATGGYVRVLREYHHCPVLIGSDQVAISLAEMVEAIDEFVDYEALCNEYPTLSSAQINGAISFLRKLSQTNSQQIDFDAIEDEQIANDAQLIETLKQAIADKEIVRVLGNNQ